VIGPPLAVKAKWLSLQGGNRRNYMTPRRVNPMTRPSSYHSTWLPIFRFFATQN